MPPCNSRSVGWRSMPPTVVAVRSPMAWMELMANSSPSAIQPEGSNVMPKGISCGRENHAASPMPDRSTIPAMNAAA